MHSAPVTLAHTPSSASTSRTSVPLPTPPMDGLHDSSPIVSIFGVSSSVRAPARAAPAAASHPACPPPITHTVMSYACKVNKYVSVSVPVLHSPSYAAFATLAYVLVENAERDGFCLLIEARQRRIELLRRRNRDSIGRHRRHMGAYSFRVELDTQAVFLSYRRMKDTIRKGLYISRTMSASKTCIP